MPSRRLRDRLPLAMGTAALALLVCAVFFPMLSFDFVDLDVDQQILANPYVRGLSWSNIVDIFTSRSINSYYPVRTLSFAADYQLWGFRPLGFQLTNGLVHLANVLLLFLLIRRWNRGAGVSPASSSSGAGVSPASSSSGAGVSPALRPNGAGVSPALSLTGQRPELIAGETPAPLNPAGERPAPLASVPQNTLTWLAAVAAAWFAIHPLVVEPVVWTCGREELLMTLGALGALHFHLTASRRHLTGGRRGWLFHLLAVAATAFACLSNAVGAVIPLLIVAMDLSQSPRAGWRRIAMSTLPLWAIAAATIVLKQLDPQAAELVAPEAPLFSASWLLLVLKVYWLNLASIAWPAALACDYGRIIPYGWTDPAVVMGAVAALASAAALVLAWRSDRQVFWGLAWFLLAMAPTSQLLPHHVHRADRFLYLPLAGLVTAGAALAIAAVRRWPASGRGVLVAALLVLVPLVGRTVPQIQTWRNSLTLWENCARVVPHFAIARRTLADHLARSGRWPQAMAEYEAALTLEPDRVETLTNFAAALVDCPEPALRRPELAVELARRANQLSLGKSPVVRRCLAVAYSDAGTEALLAQQVVPALELYRNAVAADPQYEEPRFKLAGLLAACPDPALRDPVEAIRHAEEGVRLSPGLDTARLMILSDCYAAAERYGEAAEAVGKAIHLPEVVGNAVLADELQRRWNKYRQLSWQSGTK